MSTHLPRWLEQLRRSEIVERVRSDPRSIEHRPFLGVDRPTAMEAIGWGQATFDEPWEDLSPEDRVLLYAYFNQRGHLEELTAAFRMLFAEGPPDEDPIIVDLGCGPFTGGLAAAGVLGPECRFDYIGMDRSHAMRRFGEHLAVAATRLDTVPEADRHWTTDLASVPWRSAPGWRPVIVVVSYLLASSTLNAVELIGELEDLFQKLGRGQVTVLYTNSIRPDANRSFPVFRRTLQVAGFELYADDIGRIDIARLQGQKERPLRYALFHRRSQVVLSLDGG